MKLLKKIPFTHQDMRYEVRVLYNDDTINIAVFSNNHPANGIRYQIKIPKYITIEKLHIPDHLQTWIEMSKKDIIENRWEKFKQLV